jgi:hypothetical protein
MQFNSANVEGLPIDRDVKAQHVLRKLHCNTEH